MMNNNVFCDKFFNREFVNQEYYQQCQEHIRQYQNEQDKEIQNVVKAVHDLCEAFKKLDSQHQQKAFYLSLDEMARELRWSNDQH